MMTSEELTPSEQEEDYLFLDGDFMLQAFLSDHFTWIEIYEIMKYLNKTRLRFLEALKEHLKNEFDEYVRYFPQYEAKVLRDGVVKIIVLTPFDQTLYVTIDVKTVMLSNS